MKTTANKAHRALKRPHLARTGKVYFEKIAL